MRNFLKVFLLFFITFFFIASDGFGQKMFVKGYIITNKGEKLSGLIQKRDDRDENKYTSCVFKLNETEEPIVYYPDNIFSYKCANDQYYISKTLEIDGKSQRLFLKCILDGGKIDLFSFTDSSGSHYLAQKDKELIKLYSYYDIDSLKNEIYSKENKELQYKLKEIFKEIPEIKKEIENIVFEKEFLISVVTKYNYKYQKKYKIGLSSYKDVALRNAVVVMKQVEPLLVINPDSAYSLIKKGMKMASSGKYLKLQARFVELEGRYFETIGEYVKAHESYMNGLESFKALGFKPGITSVWINLGQLFLFMGEIQQAEEYFKNALNILDSFSNSKSIINKANISANIGNLFKEKGDLAKALEYQFKAKDIYQSVDSIIELSIVYTNIGDIYLMQKDYKKALELFRKSSEYRELKGQFNGLMDSWIGIAACYRAMGECEKAKEILLKVINFKSQSNFRLSAGISYLQLGKIELKEKKLNESKQYIFKALDIFKEINAGIKIAEAYEELGIILQQQKEYAQAMDYFKKCFDKSFNLGSQKLALEALELQTEVCVELGDFKKAFEIQEQKFKLQLKFSREVQKKELALIEAKHELARNELKIDNLEQTNNSQELEIEKKRYQNALLLTCIIVILLMGVMVYLRLKAKQNKKEQKLIHQKLDIENKLLRNQFDPHFIFNGLNSVQAFISEQNIKDAAIFLSEFSKLMRHILNSTRNELICFSDEIELLNLYLKLERHRHNYSFEYSIVISEDIDETCIKVPPFMTQPFIENALVHGFSDVNINKKLTVGFSLGDKEENLMKCEIADNGKGFNKTIKDNKKHNGVGTKLTKERLDLYQNNFNKELSINVENLDKKNKNYPGTKVLMDIPYFVTN